MSEPMFGPKRAAMIIRGALLQRLHDLQNRIMRLERFGADSVAFPKIQSKPGETMKLSELLAEHKKLVHEINMLNNALMAATELELQQFVEQLVKARGG